MPMYDLGFNPPAPVLHQASTGVQLRPPRPAAQASPPVPSLAANAAGTHSPGSSTHAGLQPEESAPSSSMQQQPHKASIYAVALNPSGNVVASGSNDHVIRLWDTRSYEKVCSFKREI